MIPQQDFRRQNLLTRLAWAKDSEQCEMLALIDRPCVQIHSFDNFCAACKRQAAMADALEALSESSASSETPIVEPEVVWHYDCPTVVAAAILHKSEDPGIEYSHPVMRLVQSMDDEVGHKRVYQCPKCDAIVDVNFPPQSASSETQEDRSDRSEYAAYVRANRTLIESPGEIARVRESAERMQAWNVIRLLDSHEAMREVLGETNEALAACQSQAGGYASTLLDLYVTARAHGIREDIPTMVTAKVLIDAANPLQQSSPSSSGETSSPVTPPIDLRAAEIDRLIRGGVQPEERKDADGR